MTPEQALQVLDRAAAMATLPRQGHVDIQYATLVLIEALRPKPLEGIKEQMKPELIQGQRYLMDTTTLMGTSVR